MGEDSQKAGELGNAAKESAKFQGAIAAAKTAAEKAQAVAARQKFIQDNMKPDGTVHFAGKRYFPDGQLVDGANEH